MRLQRGDREHRIQRRDGRVRADPDLDPAVEHRPERVRGHRPGRAQPPSYRPPPCPHRRSNAAGSRRRGRASPRARPDRRRAARSARSGDAGRGSDAAPGSRARGRRAPRCGGPVRSRGPRSRGRPPAAGVVAHVEELRQRVVVVVQLAAIRLVVVRMLERGGACADRAVDRKVSSDRGEPVFHRPGNDIEAGIGETSTGTSSRCPRRTSSPLGVIDISCTDVTPRDAASAAPSSWNSST